MFSFHKTAGLSQHAEVCSEKAKQVRCTQISNTSKQGTQEQQSHEEEAKWAKIENTPKGSFAQKYFGFVFSLFDVERVAHALPTGV